MKNQAKSIQDGTCPHWLNYRDRAKQDGTNLVLGLYMLGTIVIGLRPNGRGLQLQSRSNRC